jgi:hypothetical protein
MMMDLVLAVRSLKRAPFLSAVAVLTIALGIGATTTLYSVFDAVWLEPIFFRDTERLVALTLRDGQGQARGMSVPNFTDLHECTTSFETLTGFNLAVKPRKALRADVFSFSLGWPYRTYSADLDHAAPASLRTGIQ